MTSPARLVPLLLLGLLTPVSQAQGGYVPCTQPPAPPVVALPLASANHVLTLPSASAPNSTKAVVAYLPCYDQYYAFHAGNPTFAYEVFDGLGAHLFITTSFGLDGRSIWWNPTTGNLELTTYQATSAGPSRGMFTVGLDAQAYYTGLNAQIMTPVTGLAGTQCAPAYNPHTDELYSRDSSATVMVADRTSGALLHSTVLDVVAAGSPSLLIRTIGYTNVVGHELVVGTASSAVLFDLAGAYAATVPLGMTLSNYGMTGNVANGLFWMYDQTSNAWHGFELFGPATTLTHEPGAFMPVTPVPATNGDTGVVLLQSQLTATLGPGQVTALDLVAAGTGDDLNGVALVTLVQEDPASTNGLVDGADLALASGTYPADDGTLTLTTTIDVPLGVTVSLLVVYDLSPTAAGAAPPALYEVTLANLVATAVVLTPLGDPVGSTEVDVRCPLVLCGDCNGDGQVSILDALVGAQHAAGIATLVADQFSNCNVTGVVEPAPGPVVDVLDALVIAQSAAGLPAPLACCVP